MSINHTVILLVMGQKYSRETQHHEMRLHAVLTSFVNTTTTYSYDEINKLCKFVKINMLKIHCDKSRYLNMNSYMNIIVHLSVDNVCQLTKLVFEKLISP